MIRHVNVQLAGFAPGEAWELISALTVRMSKAAYGTEGEHEFGDTISWNISSNVLTEAHLPLEPHVLKEKPAIIMVFGIKTPLVGQFAIDLRDLLATFRTDGTLFRMRISKPIVFQFVESQISTVV
jgi:hypothetical protein